MACICQPLSSFFKRFLQYFWWTSSRDSFLLQFTSDLFFCAIYSVFIWYGEREVASMKAHLDGIFFLKKKTSVWVKFCCTQTYFFNVFNCHRSYSQSIHYTKLTQNGNFSREICNLRNSHEFIKICIFFSEKIPKSPTKR